MLQANPRALAVLNLAAEKSGWGSPLPRGTGRGIGLQFAFGSYLSCVVEVEVTPPGEISVHRAVVAVDCGMTVNPDTVQAQIQGGLILGLGTAMYNEITLTGGAMDQSNFHDYRATAHQRGAENRGLSDPQWRKARWHWRDGDGRRGAGFGQRHFCRHGQEIAPTALRARTIERNLERDAKKWTPVFRVNPALNY